MTSSSSDDVKQQRHEAFQRLGTILSPGHPHADLRESVRLHINTAYEAMMERIRKARIERKRTAKAS